MTEKNAKEENVKLRSLKTRYRETLRRIFFLEFLHVVMGLLSGVLSFLIVLGAD